MFLYSLISASPLPISSSSPLSVFLSFSPPIFPLFSFFRGCLAMPQYWYHLTECNILEPLVKVQYSTADLEHKTAQTTDRLTDHILEPRHFRLTDKTIKSVSRWLADSRWLAKGFIMRHFLVGVGTYLLLFRHTIQSDHYVVVLTLIFYTYRLLHVYVFIVCIIIHCKNPLCTALDLQVISVYWYFKAILFTTDTPVNVCHAKTP